MEYINTNTLGEHGLVDAHLTKKEILINRGIIKRDAVENIKYQQSIPRGITLNLCGHCNYNCIYCPQSFDKLPKEYIDPNIIKKVFAEFKGNAVYVQMGSRGENLLHPEFFDIIRFIKTNNPLTYICLNTNASILTDKMIENIIAVGIDQVVFSLQTIIPELYKKISGTSNHEKVVKKIKNFITTKKEMNSNMLLSAQYLPFPENLPYREDFINYWKEYDIEIQISSFHSWGDKFDTDGNEKIKRYPCPYLWLYPTVTHNGNLVPCYADFYDEMAYGSLKINSLVDLWHGEKIKQLRTLHLRRRWDEIPMCKDCEGFTFMTNGFMYKDGRFYL